MLPGDGRFGACGHQVSALGWGLSQGFGFGGVRVVGLLALGFGWVGSYTCEMSVSRHSARYNGHVNHPGVGVVGHAAIRGARVLVVGCGGLAAPVVSYLTAAGVGVLGLVDHDVVSESNLARQFLFSPADVGVSKVSVLARWVASTNADVRVKQHAFELSEANAQGVIRSFDVVVDATDNSASRYVVDRVCGELGVPLVWGAMSAGSGCVTVLHCAPSPVGLTDIFPVPAESVADGACATAGVVNALCGVVGARLAAEVLRVVVSGRSPVAGRLSYFDAFGVPTVSYSVSAGAGQAASAGQESGTVAGAVSHVDAVSDADVAVPAGGWGARVVRPDEVARVVGQDNTWLVDVRSPDEVAAGMIPGAQHVPVHEIGSAPGRLGFADDATVVLYCARDDRSALAAATLRSVGPWRVQTLAGGYQAWVERG